MTTQAPAGTHPGVLPLTDGTYAVASSDPARAPYHVEPDGAALRCPCLSYTYAKDDPKTCKHTRAVRAYRAQQAPPDPCADGHDWQALRTPAGAPATYAADRCSVCGAIRERRMSTDQGWVARMDAAVLAADADWAAAERARLAALNERVAEQLFR